MYCFAMNVVEDSDHALSPDGMHEIAMSEGQVEWSKGIRNHKNVTLLS